MSLDKEKETVTAMIHLYCRGNHDTDELCESCAKLLVYADKRLTKCRYGDDKPQCKNCPVHCYSPAKREQITQVMRYAGPRMLLKHPVQGVRHLLNRKKPGLPPKTGG